MEIKTKAYGIVEIDPENIITFESGIIGFDEKRKFTLLRTGEPNEVLIWLQSLEDENLAFIVIEPRLFKPDYRPEINIRELDGLEVENADDLVLYTIVVIPADPKKMTANLRAPIVINAKNKKAKQVVLNDDSYKVKEAILNN